jgi:ferric-dicitrate binding protein FerR (iron transport regulator)
MTERREDPELRALFDAQRRDDAQHVPAFADIMARARADDMARAHAEDAARATTDAARVTTDAARATTDGATTKQPIRVGHRRGWIGALAAAAAIAAVIFIPRVNDGGDAFEQAVRAFGRDPALGAWQSPTDGLLNLPGGRLLTTIPAIGAEQ